MMRREVTLALAAAITWQFPGLTTGVRAQQSNIPCDSFQKNADGSWTVLSTTFMEGPRVKVQEGAVLPPGYTVLGYDIPDIIAKACPNATVDVPAGAAPAAPLVTTPLQQSQRPQTPQPPPAPQMSLSRYADANGSIDVDRLTCAQLNDASNDEAEVLLAWYSGLYSGLAKKRTANAINIARLHYVMRNVVDYCRTNRDKKLTQVLELMLK